MTVAARIQRDRNGVAHIRGRSLSEIYQALGYAHGRDRGMQLLLMRILGQGQACEFLEDSEEMLAVDRFFRKMNWKKNTGQQISRLPTETAALLDAYCTGINTAFRKRIPWEFRLLGYRPELWSVSDILLIMRMMGYLTLAQSQGEMERLLVEMIQAGIGEEKLHSLFPGILGGMDIDLIRQVKLGDRIVETPALWRVHAAPMMASNNWAVAGGKTASGFPIMASDPHLEVNRLPNVWYEVVLETPNRYAMGVSLPGTPGILIGRNPDVAWSATYAFMDATDSWIEHCRDGKYRRGSDQWHPFHKRTETIRRKKNPPVTVTFYENEHGVLDGDPNEEGFYLATAWAPADSGAATLINMLGMWETRDVATGMDRLKHVETAWNFVLADRSGNIGYQMSGLLPKRRAGVSGFVPLPGWAPENDWQGFVDPEDLPRQFNPECGYVVTANQDLNDHGTACPINICMGPYRAERIGQLLEGRTGLTCEDMFPIQHDVYSRHAEAFMEILSPLLPDSVAGNLLKNWDCCYGSDSQGAWLFERFYKQLHSEVFGKNGFGESVTDYLERCTGIFADFYLYFDKVLLSENSPWFEGEERAQIYRRAAETALAAEPQPWGRNQQVLLAHLVFGGRLPQWCGFDRGPVTIVGNRGTPHQGQIYDSAGRTTSFAPSLRVVTDMGSDLLHTNMSGGPSDRRFSKWYCSDLENWIQGRYKPVRPEEPNLKKFK